MSRHQHGFSWTSTATLLYCSSLLVGLQGYFLYWHKTVVCTFEVVVLPLLVHVKGYTKVCHL